MVGINIDVLAQFLQIKLHKSSTAKVFFRVLSSTFFSQVSQFENTARFNFSFLFFFRIIQISTVFYRLRQKNSVTFFLIFALNLIEFLSICI